MKKIIAALVVGICVGFYIGRLSLSDGKTSPSEVPDQALIASADENLAQGTAGRFKELSGTELSILADNALKGDRDAMKRLARIYTNGDGVPKDLGKGFDLYFKLAELGDVDGIMGVAHFYRLGIGGVDRDFAKALFWLEKAVEKNQGKAALIISSLYAQGDETLPVNTAESQKWVRKSELMIESSQDPALLSLLAFHYKNGKHFPHDYEKAFQHYKAAAELNSWSAMINVVQAYYEGVGTEKNHNLARDWMDRAYEKRGEQSLVQLARISPSLTQEQVEQWYRGSAKGSE